MMIDPTIRELLKRHGVDVEPATQEAKRVRAIALHRGGKTIREVARELGVPRSTIGKWVFNTKREPTT
jgi:transposase